MNLSFDLQARHAWRGALVAASLNAVGMPLDIVLARRLPDMPAWPPLVSSAVGMFLIGVLLANRSRSTVRLASTVFLVNNAVIIAALWITSGYYVAAAGAWVPFQANKLGVLAVALLAPGSLVGLVSILGFAGSTIAKYLTLSVPLRNEFPIGEPWTILIYALFAGVLLLYRLRWMSLEREMLRVQSEAAVIERLARTFLAVRDYASTPVQTIGICSELIRARHPELEPILKRIDRSVDRLTNLGRMFQTYESALRWTADEVSPNSDDLLRQDLS